MMIYEQNVNKTDESKSGRKLGADKQESNANAIKREKKVIVSRRNSQNYLPRNSYRLSATVSPHSSGLCFGLQPNQLCMLLNQN